MYLINKVLIFALIFTCSDSLLAQGSNDVQGQLIIIIEAKVSYEKSLFWKKGDLAARRKTCSNLVKKFKAREGIAYYDNAIHMLLKPDSSAISDRIINFTYQPETSSAIEKCAFLKYNEFLKIMLKNLHDTNQYNFIVCYK